MFLRMKCFEINSSLRIYWIEWWNVLKIASTNHDNKHVEAQNCIHLEKPWETPSEVVPVFFDEFCWSWRLLVNSSSSSRCSFTRASFSSSNLIFACWSSLSWSSLHLRISASFCNFLSSFHFLLCSLYSSGKSVHFHARVFLHLLHDNFKI